MISLRKAWSLLALASVVGLFAASAAEATTIRFVDTFVPATTVTLTDDDDTFAFTHDLTLPAPSTNTLEGYIDGVLTAGADYDFLTDTLTSGKLSLFFGSATAPPNTSGQFDLDLGGALAGNFNFATQIDIAGSSFDVTWITTAGVLTVELTRTNAAGSVTFERSILDVSGRRGDEELDDPLAAPEPGSMVLLATGLATLLGVRRYRAKRS